MPIKRPRPFRVLQAANSVVLKHARCRTRQTLAVKPSRCPPRAGKSKVPRDSESVTTHEAAGTLRLMLPNLMIHSAVGVYLTTGNDQASGPPLSPNPSFCLATRRPLDPPASESKRLRYGE